MEKILKRPGNEPGTRDGRPNNKLYDEVLRSRPTQTDPQVLQALSSRLENIATLLNLSVEELLQKAESSPEFKEEYLEARSLARQIALQKK